MSKIAVLVGQDFEDSELRVPVRRLEERGHQVEMIGAKAGETVRGKRGEEQVVIARAAGEVRPDDYDALVIPGGYSPDHLRTDEDVVAFVRDFGASAKPLAAVCHGPQLLIEAELVRGRTLTSWPSVRTDLVNAGARWIDREVAEDGALLTSRKPDDLEAFSDALLARLPSPAHAEEPAQRRR